MKYNSQWPGTEGASLGGAAGAASGARPSSYQNEGWQLLTAIMNGKELPNWIGGDLHQRFDRAWDSDVLFVWLIEPVIGVDGSIGSNGCLEHLGKS